MSTRQLLRAGLRSTPLTDPLLRGEVACGEFELQTCAATPYTETFRLMAREMAYDIAEMPIATQLLAVDAGKPLTALPIILAGGEFPHRTLICLAESSLQGPADLHNRRVGIRAYAQTTSVWLRGILQHEYGLSLPEVTWLVTEDSHVETFVDPANVRPAPKADLFAMLREGMVDAIITSPHTIKDMSGLRTVIAQPEKAGADWQARTGLHSVNHVLSIQVDLVQRNPALLGALATGFSEARARAVADPANKKRFLPYGEAPNRKSVEQLLAFAFEQRLTSRPYHYDDLFLPWPERTKSNP